MRQSRALWLLDRLEREPRAGAVIDALRTGIRSLPLGRGRDALPGRWLGHPVHLGPGRSRDAGLLVGVGPAAASLACRIRIGTVGEPPAGQPLRRDGDDVPVLVVREPGGAIHAPAERCRHLAGPLSEGIVADGCVRCPWHGSVFRLSDGWNRHGPATAPQPAFAPRTVDGHVDVRLRQEPAAKDGDTDRTRTAAEAGTAHGHGS